MKTENKNYTLDIDFDIAAKVYREKFNENLSSLSKELGIFYICFSWPEKKCTISFNDVEKFMVGRIKYGI